MESQSELMMAVIVASTAFAGLTGVTIGQITSPLSSRLTNMARKRLRQPLEHSFYLGLAAILLAILWFLPLCVGTAEGVIKLTISGLSVVALVAQLIVFWRGVQKFWSHDQ